MDSAIVYLVQLLDPFHVLWLLHARAMQASICVEGVANFAFGQSDLTEVILFNVVN